MGKYLIGKNLNILDGGYKMSNFYFIIYWLCSIIWIIVFVWIIIFTFNKLRKNEKWRKNIIEHSIGYQDTKFDLYSWSENYNLGKKEKEKKKGEIN